MKAKFDPTNHKLVPKHEKLSEKAKKEVLDKYNLTLQDLPKILKNDPALQNLDVKVGDVIKITRKSATSGETHYFRGVISA